jgi:hypothetical protein
MEILRSETRSETLLVVVDATPEASGISWILNNKDPPSISKYSDRRSLPRVQGNAYRKVSCFSRESITSDC